MGEGSDWPDTRGPSAGRNFPEDWGRRQEKRSFGGRVGPLSPARSGRRRSLSSPRPEDSAASPSPDWPVSTFLESRADGVGASPGPDGGGFSRAPTPSEPARSADPGTDRVDPLEPQGVADLGVKRRRRAKMLGDPRGLGGPLLHPGEAQMTASEEP